MKYIISGTVDIIKWTDLVYYEFFQYWDKQISAENTKIGRCMVVLHRVGIKLRHWILTAKGTVIARTMVQYVTWYEFATNDCKRPINQFHENPDIRLGQGNDYAVGEDELDDFVNVNVTNSFEGNKGTYKARKTG